MSPLNLERWYLVLQQSEMSCKITPSNFAFMLKVIPCAAGPHWCWKDFLLLTYSLLRCRLYSIINANLHMQDDWKGRIVFILIEVKS